jgi:hypothetical protein
MTVPPSDERINTLITQWILAKHSWRKCGCRLIDARCSGPIFFSCDLDRRMDGIDISNVIEYLIEENRVPPRTDRKSSHEDHHDQRRRLAAKAKQLGRKLLAQWRPS